MDRSFLSDQNVVAASRNFVCVRAATYENEPAVLRIAPRLVKSMKSEGGDPELPLRFFGRTLSGDEVQTELGGPGGRMDAHPGRSSGKGCVVTPILQRSRMRSRRAWTAATQPTW